MLRMATGEREHEWITIAAKKPERRHWAVAAVLVVAGLPAGLWLGSSTLLLAAVTGLICILVLVRIGSACSVTVTDKDVQHRTFFGRMRRIPRKDIATVLYAPRLVLGNNQHADWLVLLDEHDRPLLRLTSSTVWPQEGIERVREAVGGSTVDMPDTQAPAVRLRYPKAMPYRTAHPALFAGICVVTFFGVIALGVITVAALNP
jgi:hypothetical protein